MTGKIWLMIEGEDHTRAVAFRTREGAFEAAVARGKRFLASHPGWKLEIEEHGVYLFDGYNDWLIENWKFEELELYD